MHIKRTITPVRNESDCRKRLMRPISEDVFSSSAIATKIAKRRQKPIYGTNILDCPAAGWQIVGRLAVPLQFAYETHLIDGNTLVDRGKVVG